MNFLLKILKADAYREFYENSLWDACEEIILRKLIEVLTKKAFFENL